MRRVAVKEFTHETHFSSILVAGSVGLAGGAPVSWRFYDCGFCFLFFFFHFFLSRTETRTETETDRDRDKMADGGWRIPNQGGGGSMHMPNHPKLQIAG